MARLILSLHGQEVTRFDLQDGVEYVIGRAPECAIVLTEVRGISRHHLKLFQRDGIWLAESLSRFVPLQKDGGPQETIELKVDSAFYAPPYEFQFEATKETPETSPEPVQASAANGKQSDENAAMLDDTVVRGNIEATVAGATPLVPYLKIRNMETDEHEVLKLEGNLWIAGRGSVSEIPLPDGRTSRRHFELSRSREGFHVTDLGSSNGTKLNGQRLPPHEPTKLESGDVISVLEIEIMFEIRDVQLSNRLQNMPQTFPTMPPQHMHQHLLPASINSSSLPAEAEQVDWKKLKNWRPENIKKVDLKKINWKKNWIRVALVILVPIVIVAAIFQNSGPDRTVAGNPNDPLSFDKMTPDQKNAIKDAFSLARNHYMQGKYELCLTDLATLHQMIPQYEDSKDLDAYCNQGRELVLRQLDIDRRKREADLLEQQIAAVIDNCRDRLRNKGTVEQVRQCLAEAIELNPEHPAIAEMIGAAQGRENDEKILREGRAARRKKSQNGEAIYYKAKSFYVNGKLAKAVREYERFIAGTYPDLDSVKEAAKREVASVKLELDKKVTSYLDQCKALGEKSRYKEAYLACDKALAEDPNNEAASQLRGQMLSSLRRDQKSIYEDSVLEESLGNVDSAKEKWKKIMSDDLDFDEYYKKAKILLRKYGVEM